jgi:uncharacterized protein YeaO (DUF488 family)
MIQVKNMFDVAEQEDGERIWVEPIGLTLDLREWCKVDHILSHLGPSMELCQWFETHPQGYEYFRAKYHDALAKSPYRAAMIQLVAAARRGSFTLIHQSDDPEHNTATALHEYLCELEAYAPPEA